MHIIRNRQVVCIDAVMFVLLVECQLFRITHDPGCIMCGTFEDFAVFFLVLCPFNLLPLWIEAHHRLTVSLFDHDMIVQPAMKPVKNRSFVTACHFS